MTIMRNPPSPHRSQVLREEEQQRARATAVKPDATAAQLAQALNLGVIEEVLANPVLALVLLERPDFWRDVDVGAQREVAASPHCPESLGVWTLQQREDRGYLTHVPWPELVKSQALPLPLRRQAFARVSAADVQDRLLDLAAAVKEVLTEDEQVLLTASATTVPLRTDTLEALCTLGRPGVELALQRPECPTALLERHWTELDPNLKHTLLSHSHLPTGVIAQGLASLDRSVRADTAQRCLLSPAQFEAAVRGTDVRLVVARNPHLPVKWMEHLALDASEYQRGALAKNASLPPALQLRLAADASKYVRVSLLGNQRITAEARVLAKRKNHEAQP